MNPEIPAEDLTREFGLLQVLQSVPPCVTVYSWPLSTLKSFASSISVTSTLPGVVSAFNE
jgi:hypothetical protein